MRLGLIIVSNSRTFFLIQFVYFARGHRGEDPPDPIPNSEVKLPIADDTACWWESRSLRAFFCPFHPSVSRTDFFCPEGETPKDDSALSGESGFGGRARFKTGP